MPTFFQRTLDLAKYVVVVMIRPVATMGMMRKRRIMKVRKMMRMITDRTMMRMCQECVERRGDSFR